MIKPRHHNHMQALYFKDTKISRKIKENNDNLYYEHENIDMILDFCIRKPINSYTNTHYYGLDETPRLSGFEAAIRSLIEFVRLISY